MKKLLLLLSTAYCSLPTFSLGQNNALQINGAYMTISGGTNASPVRIIVNQNNTAGITRNGGHIVSEGDYNYVQWNMGTGTGNYVVPFGVGSVAADYIPFTFNKTTTGSADVSFATRYTPATNNTPLMGATNVAAVSNWTGVAGSDPIASVIDRWWNIQSTAAVTADLTFSYRGSENTTGNPSGLVSAQHWNGASWDIPTGNGTAVTSGIGTCNVTGASTFSPWILSTTSTLPIELLTFTGISTKEGNLLQWSTATEINNDYFTLETAPAPSINSGQAGGEFSWTPIATIDGAGNSNEIKNYQYLDKQQLAVDSWQIVYYRLMQTDFNGTYKYSNIISLQTPTCKLQTYVYPNPATDQLNVFFLSEAEATVEITDITGRRVPIAIGSSQQLAVSSGSTTINIRELPKGVYFLKVQSGNGQTVERFIKE